MTMQYSKSSFTAWAVWALIAYDGKMKSIGTATAYCAISYHLGPSSWTQTLSFGRGSGLSSSMIPFVEPPLDPQIQMPLPEGAIKYEMTPLPDALVDTTVFVGNLGDFVTDDTLSKIFARVATANTSVPGVVARKPNNYSMGYGFVTFRTVEEKEAAIERFHGYELEGKRIKVEAIKLDGPRTRVPEKLLYFTLGEVKQFRGGSSKTLRSVSDLSTTIKLHDKNRRRKKVKKSTTPTNSKKVKVVKGELNEPTADKIQIKRISKEDVERLSRGQTPKQKQYGSRGVPHKLNEDERAAFERSEIHGFVTIEGKKLGYGKRSRRTVPLANIHRQWCDARAKPQIILSKATARVNGMVADHIILDFSPLRSIEAKILRKYHADVVVAAAKAGMKLKICEVEDLLEEETLCSLDDEECIGDQELIRKLAGPNDIPSHDWAIRPIWQLPSISFGVFEGDRTNAKTMAKELSVQWGLREDNGNNKGSSGDRRGSYVHKSMRGGGRDINRQKSKGLREHRRRRERDVFQ